MMGGKTEFYTSGFDDAPNKSTLKTGLMCLDDNQSMSIFFKERDTAFTFQTAPHWMRATICAQGSSRGASLGD